MKKNSLISNLLLVLFFIFVAVNLRAASFTINFSDIELDNVQPGIPVSLLQKASFPLGVTNTELRSQNMFFEVVPPEKDQMKEGYEPIPNLHWLKFEKDNFWLKPNQTENLDLVIYAPYDEKLFGKKYEAILVTYTMEGQLKVNLKSKVLISFSADHYAPSLVNEMITESTTNNNFLLLSPKLLSLDKVRLNKNLMLANVMVTNSSAQVADLEFYAIGLQNVPQVPGLVSFKTPSLVLKPRETKVLDINVNLPLLRYKSSEPMLFMICAKDIKRSTPLGQYLMLDLNFK